MSMPASWLVILFTRTRIHVENAVKDHRVIEVEEAEPEYQEEQQPEEDFVIAEQASEQELTNSDTQQDKPRCILTQCLYISLILLQILNIPVHYVYRSCLIPRCMG